MTEMERRVAEALTYTENTIKALDKIYERMWNGVASDGYKNYEMLAKINRWYDQAKADAYKSWAYMVMQIDAEMKRSA